MEVDKIEKENICAVQRLAAQPDCVRGLRIKTDGGERRKRAGSDCHGCSDCSETQGALKWNGEPAKNLLSLNGLSWPVSTDGKSIQIGCQHHSVDEWRAFDDRVIAKMDSAALEFWKEYKLVVLDLAEVRKNMEEES